MKAALLFVLIALQAIGQSVTTVESYGIALATTAVKGLGTNITPTNSWEYAAAQAAGITWGRFDCAWGNVELQTLPGNTSGGYTWPTACADALTYGATYGVHPMMDALYDATYGSILTGTTSTDSPIGTTVVHVTVSTGSFSSIVNAQTYLYPAGGNFYGAKNSYPGILITANNGSSTITLASALTSDMPSGTAITLNLQLYPPFQMPSAGNIFTNASVVAYENYAAYIAGQIHASGLTGQVEIWNEPPWPFSSWDYAANLYDTPPAGLWQVSGNSNTGLELPLGIGTLTPPSGVTYDNGATNKSGGNSLFWDPVFADLQSQSQAQIAFGTESFHPYGNNPEDSMWDPVCLATNATPSLINNIYTSCVPVGLNTGSSFKLAVAVSTTSYRAGGGVPHSITETGLFQTGGITNTQVSRFDLRQFLGYEALGITPVMFYRLYNDANYQWCSSSTGPTCNPVYYAFQSLMQDIAGISHAPVGGYTSANMPQVSSYTGYYPLATMNIVGSVPGGTTNSILHFAYQRTYGGTWTSVSSPSTVTLTETIPTGMQVLKIKDTVTGSAVSYTAGSGTYSYPVADDPIEVQLGPALSGGLACLGGGTPSGGLPGPGGSPPTQGQPCG